MIGKDFINRVANCKQDFLQEFLNISREHDIRFCLIGGLAVNAYCEPVVSLDVDIVIASSQLGELVNILRSQFTVDEMPHSINISSPDSDLRIQIQTDPRFQEFLERTEKKSVLGYDLPVASLKDVLKSKLWAYQDENRRKSKRQKDLADIMRIIETHPELDSLLPDSLKGLLR